MLGCYSELNVHLTAGGSGLCEELLMCPRAIQ